MAATDPHDRASAIVAAALALPGVLAHADDAPGHGEFAIKYLHYQDAQPGLTRIRVEAPSLYLLAPLGARWSVEGSAVYDSVSGATPRYHTAISGATLRMTEERKAGDVKVTRYFDRSSYSAGVSQSNERDYRSSSGSLEASFTSDDGNRSWNVGAGYAGDTVGSTNDDTLHEHKRTAQALLGVTQAVTADDLVQLNGTFTRGRGYFSDPYKEPDIRPRRRDESVALVRWNHHLAGFGATLRTSYRFYHDTFGIDAHTLGAEWVQRVGPVFTITPSLRLYSQSAAKFYFDPVYDPDVGAPYPPGYFTNPPQFISPDQRLSAFGAVTAGLKVAVQITPDWSTDVKAEHYEQRSSWRVGGPGSPGLDPFRATFIQVGIGKRF